MLALETKTNWTYVGVSYHGTTTYTAIIQGNS